MSSGTQMSPSTQLSNVTSGAISLSVVFLVILLIIFIIGLLMWLFGSSKDKKENYNAAEHQISADGDPLLTTYTGLDKTSGYNGILLQFPTGSVRSADHQLAMENGLKLTYGSIISLAGDFYATKDLKPISSGATEAAREIMFREAFESLNSDSKATGEVPKILAIAKTERAAIDGALGSGGKQTPSQAYDAAGENFDINYNVATGGGTTVGEGLSKLIPGIHVVQLIPEGRYLAIAKQNMDHFAEKHDSWNVYEVGHSLAMRTAASGGASGNVALLNRAYTIDAFASHFLSDYFSAGHLRAPRSELHSGLGSSWYNNWSGMVGDYMNKMMHDDEDKRGVWVANNACYSTDPEAKKLCNVWKMYGDAYLANVENTENVRMQQVALQRSVDEVWSSYVARAPINSTMWNYIANLDMSLPLPQNTKVQKKISTKMLPGNPKCGTCIENFGPEWVPASTQNPCACVRSSYNHVPMFQYSDETKKLYKRNSDGETMTDVADPIGTILHFTLNKDL